ncbi:hypothetical protein NRB36_004305 [Salmonella enterica]|nr:hypothetical protein [Salmonella enterica]
MEAVQVISLAASVAVCAVFVKAYCAPKAAPEYKATRDQIARGNISAMATEAANVIKRQELEAQIAAEAAAIADEIEAEAVQAVKWGDKEASAAKHGGVAHPEDYCWLFDVEARNGMSD